MPTDYIGRKAQAAMTKDRKKSTKAHRAKKKASATADKLKREAQRKDKAARKLKATQKKDYSTARAAQNKYNNY